MKINSVFCRKYYSLDDNHNRTTTPRKQQQQQQTSTTKYERHTGQHSGKQTTTTMKERALENKLELLEQKIESESTKIQQQQSTMVRKGNLSLYQVLIFLRNQVTLDCGAQNRFYSSLKFLIWIRKPKGMELEHIFYYRFKTTRILTSDQFKNGKYFASTIQI